MVTACIDIGFGDQIDQTGVVAEAGRQADIRKKRYPFFCPNSQKICGVMSQLASERLVRIKAVARARDHGYGWKGPASNLPKIEPGAANNASSMVSIHVNR